MAGYSAFMNYNSDEICAFGLQLSECFAKGSPVLCSLSAGDKMITSSASWGDIYIHTNSLQKRKLQTESQGMKTQ